MRFSGFAARTRTAFTAGFTSIAVLLSAPTVAVANPAQTELDALKAAAATGDVVSTVRLVQELLMSLPAQAGTSEPQPALFAARCWWDRLDRERAVESEAISDQTVPSVDAAFSRRRADLQLMPGLTSMFEMSLDEEIERWGPGAADPLRLRNRHIQETLPEAGAILMQFAQDRNIQAAIGRADSLSMTEPDRPEPYALIAQLHFMAGDMSKAQEAAQFALDRFPGHYLAHSVLVGIEARRLAGDHSCDTALAWERVIQADRYNEESMLMIETMLGLYQAQPDPHRLQALRERVHARIYYHEESERERAAAQSQPSGQIARPLFPPYLSAQQLSQLQTLLSQIDQLAARTP